MSATSRALAARAAAFTRWAHEPDPAAALAPARKGRLAKLADEVDPERKLPESVRLERAMKLRRARMLDLSRRSAVARAARKRAS